MLFKTLPNHNSMPMLGLGTYGLTQQTGIEAIHSAIDMGYRHIDTAATYENEEYVGEGVKRSNIDRAELFVTTKVDRGDLKRSDFIRSCENSLRKLKMDYVDLLLIHWPNNEIPFSDTLSALETLVEQGKVKHCGISNFIRSKVDQITAVSALPLITNQVEYHPLLKQEGLRKHCENKGMFLTAYSPLGQGYILKDNTLQSIADKKGCSIAQLSLRWLLTKGIAVIPKASSKSHMKANFSVFEIELNEDEMKQIDSISTRHRVIDWWPGEFETDLDVF